MSQAHHNRYPELPKARDASHNFPSTLDKSKLKMLRHGDRKNLQLFAQLNFAEGVWFSIFGLSFLTKGEMMNHHSASKKAVQDFRKHVRSVPLSKGRFYCVAIDGSAHPSTASDEELIAWLDNAGGCAGFITLVGPETFSIDPLCHVLQEAASDLAHRA